MRITDWFVGQSPTLRAYCFAHTPFPLLFRGVLLDPPILTRSGPMVLDPLLDAAPELVERFYHPDRLSPKTQLLVESMLVGEI